MIKQANDNAILDELDIHQPTGLIISDYKVLIHCCGKPIETAMQMCFF